jgi:hypothetical protein
MQIIRKAMRSRAPAPIRRTPACGAQIALQNAAAQSAGIAQNQTAQNQSQNQTGQSQTSNEESQNSQKSGQPAGGNRTPSTGEPNTTERVPGASPGNYTERKYGPDGPATTDIDHGHDHGQGDPHAHDWNNGKRGTGRSLTPEERAGADTHRFSNWIADHKTALLGVGAAVIVVSAIALAPATGGGSLAVLAFAP